jgi:hypothetical protein
LRGKLADGQEGPVVAIRGLEGEEGREEKRAG